MGTGFPCLSLFAKCERVEEGRRGLQGRQRAPGPLFTGPESEAPSLPLLKPPSMFRGGLKSQRPSRGFLFEVRGLKGTAQGETISLCSVPGSGVRSHRILSQTCPREKQVRGAKGACPSYMDTGKLRFSFHDTDLPAPDSFSLTFTGF